MMTSSAQESPGGRLVGSDRVLAVLVELARRPEGAGLEELSLALASPKPTIHRALGALTRAGLAAKQGPGRYVLGDEFLRLAFAHHDARPDHQRVLPVLNALAVRFGETSHYAVLDGAEVVYRAKADPPSGAVRLTSTIGGRNPAHSTGVGKLLLAYALPDDDAVLRWARERRLERRTDRTITDPVRLAEELTRVRARGYALDEQENEVGINCIAVPLRVAPGPQPAGAVSVSALTYRTRTEALEREVDTIRAIVRQAGAA